MVLSAAITTRNGKALLARQFVDMSRIRIEGLLAAFPKLMGTGEFESAARVGGGGAAGEAQIVAAEVRRPTYMNASSHCSHPNFARGGTSAVSLATVPSLMVLFLP